MSLFDMMRKSQEAQAVRLGIPVSRQFSDDELVESIQALAEAEHDLELEMYGSDPRNEGVPLSAPELKNLHEINGKLIPFRVTLTLPDRTEQINILATDACNANVRVVEMIFGDFNADKPQAFKLKVEPVNARCALRAA